MLLLMSAVMAIVIIVALAWWALHARCYENTDYLG